MTQPALSTQRLELRAFNRDDAPVIQSLAGNYKVSEYTLNIPYPYEDGMAEDWINAVSRKWRDKTEFAYAMILKSSRELIGAIGLHEMTETEGELGYWIGEAYWGQGYCAEAALEIIRFSFSQLMLTRIQAQHVTENTASGRVLEKIGMTHLGSEMSRDRHGGKSKMEIFEIQNR